MKPIKQLSCRFCKHVLTQTFVDLGLSPVANDYVPFSQKDASEVFYPLRVFVCTKCWLVQLPEHRSESQIFSDNYAYFSSYSSSWLTHAKNYVDMMMKRFHFTTSHLVVELASNDGYLLQYFKQNGVPVLGVEPTKNTAAVAQSRGIPTITKFFGQDTAREMIKKKKQADLIIGNNVLAHVPDLNDFVRGIKILLKPTGIVTIEFPHLLQLMTKNQFDTVYHEHYSYFSFITVQNVFQKHGLELFDVEEISTHGGSLRIYAKHKNNSSLKVNTSVDKLITKEKAFGIKKLQTYKIFSENVQKTKRAFLKFLVQAKAQGKSIVGYGAPAKGNTFLNYCGVRTDFIDYTVDASPHKQDHFLPGVRIPIYSPNKIIETRPDYIVILPWNIREEIMSKMKHIRNWGGKFVTAIPTVTVT